MTAKRLIGRTAIPCIAILVIIYLAFPKSWLQVSASSILVIESSEIIFSGIFPNANFSRKGNTRNDLWSGLHTMTLPISQLLLSSIFFHPTRPRNPRAPANQSTRGRPTLSLINLTLTSL